MPRIARFVRESKSTVYHVISRTALTGLSIHDVDKTYLLNLIKRLKILYCVDVLGFCLMGNHFHLVVRMHPEDEVSDEEIIKRYKEYYSESGDRLVDNIAGFRYMPFQQLNRKP